MIFIYIYKRMSQFRCGPPSRNSGKWRCFFFRNPRLKMECHPGGHWHPAGHTQNKNKKHGRQAPSKKQTGGYQHSVNASAWRTSRYRPESISKIHGAAEEFVQRTTGSLTCNAGAQSLMNRFQETPHLHQPQNLTNLISKSLRCTIVRNQK